MMTAATGLYRRIRASTERARDRIGLDQSDEMRQSRPGIPAWRTARGNTECDRRCRSPVMASLSRARSWSVAMRNGGDGLGPDVYLRCTYRVPRIDLRPASRPVDPPAASGSCRSEAASAVLAPHTVSASRSPGSSAAASADGCGGAPATGAAGLAAPARGSSAEPTCTPGRTRQAGSRLPCCRRGAGRSPGRTARRPCTNWIWVGCCAPSDGAAIVLRAGRATPFNEFPDYYTRLAKMEAEAEADWTTRGE
jgi:hypothetical protein